MSRARLEHASLYYHLKDGYLASAWSVEVTNEPLVFDTKTNIDGELYKHYKIVDPDQSAYGSMPIEKGRGWLYFEPKNAPACTVIDPSTGNYIKPPKQLYDTSFTIPQKFETSLVTVRNEFGDELPREQYDVSYRDGRIRFYTNEFPPASGTGKVLTSGNVSTVDYRFQLVSCLDGWPSDSNPPPNLPFVVVYPDHAENAPLQIGPGVTYKRRYIIDIFAKNNGQKLELLNGIYNSLYEGHAPVIDFNRTGAPLRHNGTANEDFITTLTSNGHSYQTYLTLNPGNGNILYFTSIEVTTNMTPRMSRAEIERFRGRVVVATETYSDRGIDSVGNLGNSPEPLGGFDSLRLESHVS